MDTTTLVDDQIDEGKALVDHLRQCGFDIPIAFWVLTSVDGLWLLYVASPAVDNDGLAAAYRKTFGELSRRPAGRISRSDIRLVGVQNPIVLDALAYQDDTLTTRFGGRKLGNLIIEEAYIYPK